MNRITFLGIVGLSALSLLSGCGKGEDAKAGKAAPEQGKLGLSAKGEALVKGELAKVQPLVDGAQALATEGPALTLAEYEKLLLGLASCSVTDNGIDRKCPAFETLEQRRKTRGTVLKDLAGGLAGLGRKHIGHDSPAVRLQAASLMSSLFGADASSQATLVAAASKEPDPKVLRSMLRSVGSSSGKNPAVRDLLLAKADHADEAVRKEVVIWLTSSWAAGTERTLEKAMAMIASDPSLNVKKLACESLGARGDERALPVLAKHTKDAADPLYDSCFKGVVGMWAAPVPHKKPSQKAYALTLDLLKAKPRSAKNPPWNGLSGLQWAEKPEFLAAAPWYKKADLVAALESVVTDRAANWMCRTGSVDMLQKLGTPKAKLEALAKGYAGATGEDGHVSKKLTEAIAKAK
jgi:hypothetical protein